MSTFASVSDATKGQIAGRLHLKTSDPIGVVLGTGWGDKLSLANARECPLKELREFEDLRDLPGHARKYVAGMCGDYEVLALNGRIHLNESHSPAWPYMVRRQIEIMLQLGVRKMILTCAVGSLPGTGIKTGSLVAIDGFVTLFAPPMPLYAGEFCSPEDTLDYHMQLKARSLASEYPGDLHSGGHVMVRGPFFEGRRYDKQFLASTGASVVGMSVLPEACVCALYPDVKVLGLAFVTNRADEVHSHETNLQRAHDAAAGLSQYLTKLIQRV